MKSWRDSYHLYAAVTIFFWSLAYVLTRLTVGHFSAFSLGFLRYFIASAMLLAVAVARKVKLPKKQDIKWILLTGAFGFFLYMMAFNKGSSMVTVATSSVIIATAPVMTALLARVFYKERLTWMKYAAIGVSFGGVAVLTLINGVLTVNEGNLWQMLAAVLLAVYNLLQRKLTKRYTGLEASTYSIFAGTLMLSIFAPTGFREITSAPLEQVIYVLILGAGSSALAYVCWAKAFEKAVLTSSVSNYMFVTPLLSTVLGFLLAGEVPDLPTVLGGVIILCGILLFHFGDRCVQALSVKSGV